MRGSLTLPAILTLLALLVAAGSAVAEPRPPTAEERLAAEFAEAFLSGQATRTARLASKPANEIAYTVVLDRLVLASRMDAASGVDGTDGWSKRSDQQTRISRPGDSHVACTAGTTDPLPR